VSRGIGVDILLFCAALLNLEWEEGMGCCDEKITLTGIRTKYLKDSILYI